MLVPDLDRCPAIIKLNDRDAHELTCTFAPMASPEPLESPTYAGLDGGELVKGETRQGVLDRSHRQLEHLSARIEQQDDKVGGLNHAVGTLSDRLSRLEGLFASRLEVMEGSVANLEDVRVDQNLQVDEVAEDLGRMSSVLGIEPGPAFEEGGGDEAFKLKGTFMGHKGPVLQANMRGIQWHPRV
jgi:hypothetical protein